jgi:hypothetical protein
LRASNCSCRSGQNAWMDGMWHVTAQPQICNKKDTSSVETTRCGTVTHTCVRGQRITACTVLQSFGPCLLGHLVVGRKGLARQREFIDLSFRMANEFCSWTTIYQTLTWVFPIQNMAFTAFVDAAAECQASDAFIWGVPCEQSLFYDPSTRRGAHLTYIVGACKDINRPEPERHQDRRER